MWTFTRSSAFVAPGTLPSIAIAVMSALLFATSGAEAASVVNAAIFSSFTNNGGDGSPYSGSVGTVTNPDASFFTDNSGNWHPFSLSSFGADITGGISVPTTGSYTFQFGSDDGSQLLVDGVSRLSLPGDHSYIPNNVPITLTAGTHSFEIHFYENGSGQSGVDFILPSGSGLSFVALSSVPEPSGLVMGSVSAVAGMIGFLWHTWSKRARANP
jgi:hypothetical protein